MDTMESMVRDLGTGIPDTWWKTHNWWGGVPTFMMEAHMQVGFASFGEGVRSEGQATMYVGSPPCMWVPHHVWAPHHVSGIQVARFFTMDIIVYMEPISPFKLIDCLFRLID